MKNYFIYGGFIIILIYITNKFINIVLKKVNDNVNSKKELLKYREEYRKKVYEFKKLFNEIKSLYNEQREVSVKYNQLTKNYNKTTEYCNKLSNNLDGIEKSIIKKYHSSIVPIYNNKPNIILEQKYRKWLNADEVKSIDYYKKLARKQSNIPDLPPDPSSKWGGL